MMKTRPKLATSYDIYSRIIWDDQIRKELFWIGYIDRVAPSGVREKFLLGWEPAGDIPWHRVMYIRCEEVKVWDREQRIDLFETNELPALAWANAEFAPTANTTPKSDIFKSRPAYTWAGNEWIMHNNGAQNVPCQQLKVLTWNVLKNDYKEEIVQTPKRIPFIIKELAAQQADFICLQEVTRVFAEALLAQDWAKGYFCSDLIDSEVFQKDSLLILSRYPFTVSEYIISFHKRLLVANLTLNEQAFSVATVHLTSDYGNNAREKRKEQLQLLLDFFKKSQQAGLILGDFNADTDEQTELFQGQDFADIWAQTQPQTALGHTHHPIENPLAQLFSLSQAAKRLDAIYLKNGQWQAHTTQLFARSPIPDTQNLYPSDHYGVAAVLNFEPQTALVQQQLAQQYLSVVPTYESAIVWIPPQAVYDKIQPIRAQYDSKYQRWMPHITLLYGFLPANLFPELAPLIGQILQKIQPFGIELADIQTFEHRNNLTAWLRPQTSADQPLHQLQRLLAGLFPQCSEQSDKKNGFTPHLSLGQFASLEMVKKSLPAWAAAFCEVSEIALISRTKDSPFELKYRISLGTGAVVQNLPEWEQTIHKILPVSTSAQESHHQTVLSLVETACAELLDAPVQLFPIGSYRLGVHTPDSDIDAICVLPMELKRNDFLHQLAGVLKDFCTSVRVVDTAQVPVLRMRIEGVSIDLLVANSPYFPKAFSQNKTHTKSAYDPLSWQTLAGILEAENVLKTAKNWLPLPTFRAYLRAVKAWAKVQGLVGNAWGFLGGYSWAVLTAFALDKYCKGNLNPSLEGFLGFFLGMYAGYDWEKPISLSLAGMAYALHPKKDRIPIITSVEPCFNSAKNTTRSTARILQQKFKTAARLPISERFKLMPLSGFAHTIRLSMNFANAEDVGQGLGWLEGNFIGFLIELEQTENAYFEFSPTVQIVENQINMYIYSQLTTQNNPPFQTAAEHFQQKYANWAQRLENSKLEVIFG